MDKVCGAAAAVALLAGVAFFTDHPVIGYLIVVAFIVGGGYWAIRRSGAPERARLKEMFPNEYRDD